MESSNMATPGIYKNFEAEGEIGPYVIVTHGTADYAVTAAFPKWRSAEPWPQAIL